MVLERGRAGTRPVRQRHPQLQPVHERRMGRRGLLRVRDPVARGHEVELPGHDRLLVAEAVPVQDLPVHQPRHGLQPRVWVRRYLHPGPAADVVGSEVVHEAPRADHPTGPLRQQPAHSGVTAERHVVPGQQHAFRLGLIGDRTPVHRLLRHPLDLTRDGYDGAAARLKPRSAPAPALSVHNDAFARVVVRPVCASAAAGSTRQQ
jgi:hypothetical protein